MVVNGFVIENLSQHRDLEANKKGRENKCGNDEGGEGYFRHFSHGANMSCTLFISAIRNSNSSQTENLYKIQNSAREI